MLKNRGYMSLRYEKSYSMARQYSISLEHTIADAALAPDVRPYTTASGCRRQPTKRRLKGRLLSEKIPRCETSVQREISAEGQLNILSYRGIRDLITTVPGSVQKSIVVAHDNVRGPDYFGGAHAH